MSLAEIQFPADISFGAVGGAQYSTAVTVTDGGFEQRNQNWSQSRGRWDVRHGVKSRTQMDTLIAFFRARKGRAEGFRFKDWTDFDAGGVQQTLGTGNGTTTAFQLVKNYVSGTSAYTRTITKPVAGTVKVYLDAAEQTSGWTVDTTAGIVTFSVAPGAGAVVSATYQFDVPARFDTDRMEITAHTDRLMAWEEISVVEIRL